MKNLKKFSATLLAGVCLAGFTGCSLPFDLPFFNNGNESGDEEPTVKAEKISSDLLDGKVANLMSASGLGIQEKEESQTAAATASATSSKLIVASAEGKNDQPIHELVKAMGNDVHDVRFHKKGKGSYRDWNKKFDKHHHKQVECPKTDCDEISDEIEQEEATEQTPTILSMGARVNKLYNGGDFTFVCVSSAIEGEAKLLSDSSRNAMQFENQAYAGQLPTLLNLEHTENGYSYNRLEFGSGEDKGIILVKRSESETNYHQANYWSDDYNQSYVIDNKTGITYSLAELPYIYSVTGNVVSVWKGENSKLFDYYSVGVENGELKLDKLILPESSSPYFSLINQNPLVDIYGNVVFQRVGEVTHVATQVGATLEGEQRLTEELRYPDNQKVIFAGYNQELFRRNYQGGGDPTNNNHFGEYQKATRYFRGSDGKIYRFGLIASLNNIPVKVLDENGEWQDVPETTNVSFAPQTGYIMSMNRAASAINVTFFKVTEISDGYAYFSNATWGEEAGYIHGGCIPSLMIQDEEAVGIIKMPVGGGADTELLELTAKLASQNVKSVFRTGNTAMVYQDGTDLVLWDRKTNTKSVIENVSDELKIAGSSCFTVNNLYIPFSGVDFEWKLENFSTTLIERQVKLEAFYSLLINKD